jgi:NADH-quinone oxidoreductase subunit G
MDHVAEEPVLNVSERGDRAYIGIDPGHQLDHAWSGNVVDLCPVGSLVSKDFLHKARAWDLDKSASICTGCTQGCNIMIDTRARRWCASGPRPNLEVNRHFICDTGRARLSLDEPRRPGRGAAPCGWDRLLAPRLGRRPASAPPSWSLPPR